MNKLLLTVLLLSLLAACANQKSIGSNMDSMLGVMGNAFGNISAKKSAP